MNLDSKGSYFTDLSFCLNPVNNVNRNLKEKKEEEEELSIRSMIIKY